MRLKKITLPLIVALIAGVAYVSVSGASDDTVRRDTALPTANPSSTATAPPLPMSEEAAVALALLDQIPQTSPPAPIPYSREDFGQRWADTDRNGCDTRNDQLAQDLADVTTKPGTHTCVVLSGILHDPYTGTEISFVRGQGTSELVQIDHLVPLAWAARNGADLMTVEQRTQFANDPINLQATDGSTNQSKSDRGPADWMPPNDAYGCTYAIRFIQVVSSYPLTMPADDAQALRATLNTCRSAD